MRKTMCALLFIVLLSSCNTDSVSKYTEEEEKAESKAQLLAEKVNDIAGVETAVVVINGDKALVEIAVLGELTDERLIPLKDKIEKMILESDESIKHVGVTAAPEIISRMAGEKETDFKQDENQLNEETDKKVMELTPVL